MLVFATTARLSRGNSECKKKHTNFYVKIHRKLPTGYFFLSESWSLCFKSAKLEQVQKKNVILL